MSKTSGPSVPMSLAAGTLAGGVEGLVTYPLDFIKTKAQILPRSTIQGLTGALRSTAAAATPATPRTLVTIAPAAKPVYLSPSKIVLDTYRRSGVQGFYNGCGALVLGNAGKVGVRFVSYEAARNVFSKLGLGKGQSDVISGLTAGAAEAVLMVTPSETIKTRLVEEAASSRPRFRNIIQAIPVIWQIDGVKGFYRGLWPTVMKQSANSAVRFTSYTKLKDLGNKYLPQHASTAYGTFATGAAAGTITVYATMPFDTVKTRMQAGSLSLTTLQCAQRILYEEGVTKFWRGTTPRLARLMLSGGIQFSIYERTIGWMQRVG